MASKEQTEILRTITDLLEAGLETQLEPFPETEKEFGQIINELRALDPKLEGSMAQSRWHPEFNQAVGNTTVTGTWAGACPVTFVTTVFLS